MKGTTSKRLLARWGRCGSMRRALFGWVVPHVLLMLALATIWLSDPAPGLPMTDRYELAAWDGLWAAESP